LDSLKLLSSWEETVTPPVAWQRWVRGHKWVRKKIFDSIPSLFINVQKTAAARRLRGEKP